MRRFFALHVSTHKQRYLLIISILPRLVNIFYANFTCFLISSVLSLSKNFKHHFLNEYISLYFLYFLIIILFYHNSTFTTNFNLISVYLYYKYVRQEMIKLVLNNKDFFIAAIEEHYISIK